MPVDTAKLRDVLQSFSNAAAPRNGNNVAAVMVPAIITEALDELDAKTVTLTQECKHSAMLEAEIERLRECEAIVEELARLSSDLETWGNVDAADYRAVFDRARKYTAKAGAK